MRVNTKSDDNQQEHEETKSLQLVDEARLTELYDLFETFTTLSDGESLDVESAIMVLDTTFSDPQELVNLLKTYHEDRVVLAHREQFHPEMAQLIFYLVTKSPAILDLRLEDEEGSDSLLFEVCSEKEEYQTLYALLLSAFPDEIAKGEAMVADRKRACKTLYKQLAISMQRSDLERFSALVELADHLLLIDIIDTPTLEKWLLSANKEYFQVILRVLPVIIEKLLERDHKLVPLFDVLVSDPVLHHSALSILKEVHSQFLSHNRLLAINTALGIENHKTLPPAPQVQKLEKATEVLPSLFLTREQIEQFSQQLAAPPHEHRLFANPAVLIPDVNPDRLIEAEVLDALLFKLFRQRLLDKGIALMPTRPVNTTDRLSLERVAAIANGEPMTHVVGLTADESDPSKVVLLPDFAELESLSSVPIQYIMWPMHLSDELHYGLYIYDIQQKNGHYIEPMAFDIIEHVFGNPSIEVLREQLYTSRVKQMAEDLGIAKGATKCTFLAQGMHEVFCSDYVIAAIATIAVNELDMQNPDWDKIFVNKFLNEETVRLIRLLEVQLVGEAYFNYQKPKSRRSQDFSTSKAVLLSSVLEAEQPLTRFDNAHLLCMDSLDVADLELALFATQAEEQSFCVDTMLSPIDILPQTEGRTKRFKSSPDLTFWRGSNRDKAGSEENLLHKEHKLTKDLPDNFPKKKPF